MSRMKKELFYYFLGETVADETVADPPNILLLFGWKCWWSKLLRYMFPCPLFAMMEVYLMTIALQMTACSTLLICWIIIEGEASSKITRKCGQSSWNPWHKIERKNLLQYIFEYSLFVQKHASSKLFSSIHVMSRSGCNKRSHKKTIISAWSNKIDYVANFGPRLVIVQYRIKTWKKT